MIRLKCKPINVTVIAIYAPVNRTNGHKDEESEAFYDSLQQVLHDTPKKDMLLIIGDFNARVHSDKGLMNGLIGPHTVDQMNENRERLLDLCLINDLIIANTFYQHKSIHQCTWMHPGNKQWHILDYVLINRKFRSSIHDIRVHRNAAGAVGSDHHLRRTKIRLHLKNRNQHHNPRRAMYAIEKLQDKNLVDDFQHELE